MDFSFNSAYECLSLYLSHLDCGEHLEYIDLEYIYIQNTVYSSRTNIYYIISPNECLKEKTQNIKQKKTTTRRLTDDESSIRFCDLNMSRT